MKPFRVGRSVPVERIPHPKITPAASQAEVRQVWWDLLTEHYTEHCRGPLLVLLRAGHSELIGTYECPDCQRYGRGFDAHQRGDGIGAEIMELFT